ncbi:hypothetical protein GCM10028809_41870 [Spirosoma gilvum]
MRLLSFQAETSREYQSDTQTVNSMHSHVSSFASKVHKDYEQLVIHQGFFVAFLDALIIEMTDFYERAPM